MNRPARQHHHLVEKIATKESRAAKVERKPGKRTKRWRKWAEAYKTLVA
jgi:hypothetical protein